MKRTTRAGAARFVWNRSLAEWKRQYEAGGKPSAYGIKSALTIDKSSDPDLAWLSEMPRAVADNAALNLGAAFQNFFRKLKQGDKSGGDRSEG